MCKVLKSVFNYIDNQNSFDWDYKNFKRTVTVTFECSRRCYLVLVLADKQINKTFSSNLKVFQLRASDTALRNCVPVASNMFSRSKKEPEKKRNRDLSQVNFFLKPQTKRWLIRNFSLFYASATQFGLFDIPKSLDDEIDFYEDAADSDLEAELAAITTGGGHSRARPKPKAKPQIPNVDLDRMVAESLREVEDDSDVDENDPDLLNELSEITESNVPIATPSDEPVETFVPTSSISVPDLLKERITMYQQAEANAKAANDSSKARRIGRGLKTLEGLLKQAKAGRPVNMDDIPPEVTVKVSSTPVIPSPIVEPPAAVPTRSAPAPPPQAEPMEVDAVPKVDEEIVATLIARQREYKVAALTAKKAGNTESALGFVKIAKMFEAVITAAKNGQAVDLSDMPPSPGDIAAGPVTAAPIPVAQPVREEAENQNRTEDPSLVSAQVQQQEEELVTGSTVLEALVQRLNKYKAVEQAAKDEDNSSKARR